MLDSAHVSFLVLNSVIELLGERAVMLRLFKRGYRP
jgi:hypothetical protein